MFANDPEVDESIRLEPVVNDRSPPSRRTKRSVGVYLLVGAAVLLSLATVTAVVLKVASTIRSANTPVSVALPRDAAANRAEAVHIFTSFDAFEARKEQRFAAEQEERQAIADMLQKIEACTGKKDEAGFQQLVDYDRFVKRIEVTGSPLRWTTLEKRAVRTELKSSLETETSWAKLVVAGIVTPDSDSLSRVVYVYGWNSTGGEQSEHRLWFGGHGDSWKLYDWEDLSLGLPESLRWNIYVKYNDTPLMEGHNRWVKLLREADGFIAGSDREAAKAKMRQAESQLCPRELVDQLWNWTAHRWSSLGEFVEAERCYKRVAQPINTPGIYLGLLATSRWKDPTEALKYARLYEEAVGPGPDLLRTKAALLERLSRRDEAAVERKKLLRIDPDDAHALAEFFLSLPKGDKSEFDAQLARCEHPTVAVEGMSAMVGYRDYAGLLKLVAYLERTAPEAPGTLYVAGRAKSLNGQSDEAAGLYRRAYEAATDEKKRENYADEFVQALAASGDVTSAWNVLAEPKSAFESLFYQYDESEVELTKPEYQLLIDQFRKRYPQDKEGILREAEWALDQDRFADAERLSRSLVGEPPNSKQKTLPDDEELADYLRESASRTLAMALYKQDKLKDAYEVLGPRKEGFKQLARMLIHDEHWANVRALVQLHRAKEPQDAALHSVDAELAAHDKMWESAVRSLKLALQYSEEQDREQLKSELWDVYARSDRWESYFRAEPRIDDRRDKLFDAMAEHFAQDENWTNLTRLIDLYRIPPRDDVRIAKYRARHAWAHDEWQPFVGHAERLLRSRDENILPTYERYRLESQLFGAFLHTKNYARARQFAESSERADSRTSRLAIIAAASGDSTAAKRLFREAASEDNDASDFYHDENVGHLFLTEEFSDLQREFPVELPADAVSTLAVFLFDKSWDLRAADILAAFEQSGFRMSTPPNELTSYPATYRLQADDRATFSFVFGKGVYDEHWRLKNEHADMSGPVTQGGAWLAVGIAGWTESDRKYIERIARLVASRLADGRAGVICLPVHRDWPIFTAFPASPQLVGAWQATGKVTAFQEQGVLLESDDEDATLVANRKFERSLWDAVRRFEATPGARFTVFTHLSTKPKLDQLTLEVTTVNRKYGDLNFDGTLKTDSELIPQLKTGLSMRFVQSEIHGWQINDEKPVHRH